MGIFTLAWNSILEVGKLIALPVASARGNRRIGQMLRWGLHVLAVVTILLCLAWLNYFWDLEQVVSTPWLAARRFWLPLMFGLVYTLAWLGWWIWGFATAPADASAHPDLDDAWSEAAAALEQAGIQLAATPVFLVLGKPAACESSLFGASRLSLTVSQAPRRRDAPLHVYANEEAVYITCSGASLLARQAEMYASQPAAAESDLPQATVADRDAAADDDSLAWDNPSFDPPRAWTGGVEGLDQLEQSVALLVNDRTTQAKPLVQKQPIPQEARPHPCVLAAGDEAELHAARLAYLCRLIREARRPYCPLNTVIVLVPLAATDSERDANNFAAVVQRELGVVQDELNVSCPVVTLLCDLEKTVGCREFIERMPEEQRRRRLGVTFPHTERADDESLHGTIREGLVWLCHTLTPSLVYRLIPPPRGAVAEATTELDANIRRYQFLDQIRSREAPLARILCRGIDPANTTWQLRGCYLAATGADATREQAFVAGVFPPLLQLQNAVAWTASAIREDRLFRCWMWAGYAALAAFTLVAACLILALS